MRVIDHKKIDLTADEWKMYQDLLAGYDPKTKPEMLFHDLFETDDDGIIIFLKPPKQNYFTMEVFLFLMSIMQNQHLRIMYKRVDEAIAEVKQVTKETLVELEKIKEKSRETL